MVWWKVLLYVIVFSVIMLMAYNMLNIFVFSKLKVNKWIVLVAAILVFFLPALLRVNLQGNLIATILQSGIFVILFLWFMDISGFRGRKTPKKENVIIKPKAKPNRIKRDKK